MENAVRRTFDIDTHNTENRLRTMRNFNPTFPTCLFHTSIDLRGTLPLHVRINRIAPAQVKSFKGEKKGASVYELEKEVVRVPAQ